MINLKSVYYEERKTQDIMIEYYQIKINLITSILFLFQHNCILSRAVVYKKHMTSVAKDLILIRHQPLNKITKILILGCKYFSLYSFNYLNIIIYFYSFI